MEGALGAGLDARFEVRRGEFRLALGLSIPLGRTVALLGPNGAGKTTALATIAGLHAVQQGRISLGGVTLDDPAAGVFVPPEQRRVGVVFQDYLLFPHLTVIENVAFGLRSRGVARLPAQERAADWLGRMGLAGLEGRRPDDLSGGQAQRVALARALVSDPELLLLDEPLSALDVTTRGRLRRSLAEHLAAFPGPRLLITHDPAEAFLLASEIHVVEGGAVTQSGTAEDIRLRPRTAYAADLAGSNLLEGIAGEGRVMVAGHELHIADDVEGPVLATIRPNAVSVHRQLPEGSPRNTWATTIDLIEHLGERVRIRTGPPLILAIEITAEATEALGLAVGDEIWVSIKATEIGVQADPA
ncbi:MAG TPA: ABC transporter ATP-binding protein [Acidimicrobiia bacterium]|nr:ABC transporter ATP-binding protein [Acidimicrobiia bacterium]